EPDQDQQPLRETLETGLRASLPEYLVATQLIVLDKLPVPCKTRQFEYSRLILNYDITSKS
ncbi:hypothetical protein RA267_28860, partial [Pseudomonas syringae pv. tagetis]